MEINFVNEFPKTLGCVVEYNGKKYLLWHVNSFGKAQLMNPDGTNPRFWINPSEYWDSERNVFWSRDGTSIFGQVDQSSFFHIMAGSQEIKWHEGFFENGYIQNIGGYY